MKPLHLWLLAAVVAFEIDPAVAGGPSAGGSRISFFRPAAPVAAVFQEPVVRGQSPENGGVPIPNDAGGVVPENSGSANSGSNAVIGPEMGETYFPDASTWNAFSPPSMPDPFAQSAPYGQPGGFGQAYPSGQMPYGQAPMMGQPTPYAPYTPYGNPYAAGPQGGQAMCFPGANGPHPYDLGWNHRFDVSWMPNSNVSGGSSGGFEQFGVDYDLGYTTPFMPGWIMTWTSQFRLRNWDGPVGGAGLPGDAYRFGWDIELETPQTGPYSVSLAITPSINSDLDASMSSEAFQLDGRGIFYWQLDQYWTMALGAGYWDRVDDRVIPYAGLIYRDDFWEWRLMFPEAEVSVFLGNEPYWAKWMYVKAGYHVEAYQISTATGSGRDQVELEDWRALLGFRMDAGTYTWFVEGGWVFDREIDYHNSINPSVNPTTGFVTQVGWRY